MYAIKEAMIAKEHAHGDLDCAVFNMDMRTFGKDYEKYYCGPATKRASGSSRPGSTPSPKSRRPAT
jgi:heterodisulfide reductase subunit A-like polyferredoxin